MFYNEICIGSVNETTANCRRRPNTTDNRVALKTCTSMSRKGSFGDTGAFRLGLLYISVNISPKGDQMRDTVAYQQNCIPKDYQI